MDSADWDELRESPAPTGLVPDQRELLDHLHFCHENGPGPHQRNISTGRLVLFLAWCFLIVAGLIGFSRQVPPFLSALLFGFIVGTLLESSRHWMKFRRYWPLVDAIIDWKHVDRLLNIDKPSVEIEMPARPRST